MFTFNLGRALPCLACAPKYKQKQIWRAHSASHHHHQQQQLFIFYHLPNPIKLSRVCCSTAVCLFFSFCFVATSDRSRSTGNQSPNAQDLRVVSRSSHHFHCLRPSFRPCLLYMPFVIASLLARLLYRFSFRVHHI